MLWGPDGVMIYNDAYSVFAGGRHPRLLGAPVLEGWPEVAAFNANVMDKGFRGETSLYQDEHLVLHRHGHPEDVWMDLNYSPLLDDHDRPAGVLAIVVETTDRVRAQRAQQETAEALQRQAADERDRLRRLFDQAPSFMAVLREPERTSSSSPTPPI